MEVGTIKRLRILLCLVIGCLSLLMGIIVGFTQCTPNFNPIYTLKPINASRIVRNLFLIHVQVRAQS
jgi:hypothetical protein